MSKKHIEARRKARKRDQTILVAAIVLTLAVALSVVIFVGGDKPAAITIAPDITVDQAAQMRADGAFILDVREPEEWNEKHIPGATLIPLGELAERVNELPKDQEIVVYCRSGNRSQEGRDILLQAGFEQVASMSGGINDWIAKGYEWVTGP